MKSSNRYAWLGRVLLVLALMVLLTACNQNRESAGTRPDRNTGNHKMYAHAQDIQKTDMLPAIDKLAPAEYKTATFGLG